MAKCKTAAEISSGDVTKALQWLKEQGVASAAQKASRYSLSECTHRNG